MHIIGFFKVTMYERFNNIKLFNLLTLCELCLDTDGEREFLENRYNRLCHSYDENLNFLLDLKMICESTDGYILFNNRYRFKSDDERSVAIIRQIREVLLSNKSEIGIDVRGYLFNFIQDGKMISYRPVYSERIEESDIRNLLMEIEVVLYSSESKAYDINPKYHDFISFNVDSGNLSVDKFKEILKLKDQLGYEAELVILSYEKNYLTDIDGLEVEHTSQINVQAGYDIKSWEYTESAYVEKYIEVKAVSSHDMGFFWSKNEMNAAKRYKNRYYLYLLPIKFGEGFVIDNLIQIRDPYTNVIESDDWIKQVESYHIMKS